MTKQVPVSAFGRERIEGLINQCCFGGGQHRGLQCLKHSSNQIGSTTIVEVTMLSSRRKDTRAGERFSVALPLRATEKPGTPLVSGAVSEVSPPVTA